MTVRALLFVGLQALLLSGCMVTVPMSAEEYRADYMSRTRPETFVVSRPFNDVVGTFRRRAPACLDVAVTTTEWVGTSGSISTYTFRSTILDGSDRAELHVQQHIEATGLINPYDEPAGGYYVFVADISPVSASDTRIEMYPPARGYEVLTDVVRGWADGAISGCPDLSKV